MMRLIVLLAFGAGGCLPDDEPLLINRLESVRAQRYLLGEELAEQQSLLALLRRLDLTEEQTALVGESAALHTPRETETGQEVMVAPVFQSLSRIHLTAAREADGPRVVIDWLDRDDARHRVAFRVDPEQRRAAFEGSGEVLVGEAFRVVLPSRVQILVHFDGDAATLRLFNGPARVQLRLTSAAVTASSRVDRHAADAEPTRLPTVLCLTDETLLFHRPGDKLHPGKVNNEDDRFFLSQFASWSGSLEGARFDWQQRFIDSYRRFDEADTPPASIDPGKETAAANERTVLLRRLRADALRLHKALLESNFRALQLRAEETRVLHRLRSIRQQRRLQSHDLPDLIEELKYRTQRAAPER